MRERSTWRNNPSNRQAAGVRTADPYKMNQDHPQPSPVDYANGDPDSWAETPTKNQNVDQDYEGDHVRRNEVGLPEFRKDTFDGKGQKPWGSPGKYDNQRMSAERKASAVRQLAANMVRTSDEESVNRVSIALMSLPDSSVREAMSILKASSPGSLPDDARLRRSYACTKLAARLLQTDNEASVERMARAFFRVDDSILREMLKIASSTPIVAASDEDEDEDDKSKTSSSHEDEEEEGSTAASHDDEDEEEDPTAAGSDDEDDDTALTAEDEACLQAMMEEGQGDGLDGMFPAPPAAPPMNPAPATPVMPAAAVVSDGIGISFDEDDDDPTPPQISGNNSLASIFDDLPDVVAQREIIAAQREQDGLSEGNTGYRSVTASTKGAKKLGNVKATGATTAKTLEEALWR